MFNLVNEFLLGLTFYKFRVLREVVDFFSPFSWHLRITLFRQTFACSFLVSYRSYERECDKTGNLKRITMKCQMHH